MHFPRTIGDVVGQIAVKILELALDANHLVSYAYTPIRFEEEMKGISDASGMSLTFVRRINLFTELTQAHCSVLGNQNK